MPGHNFEFYFTNINIDILTSISTGIKVKVFENLYLCDKVLLTIKQISFHNLYSWELIQFNNVKNEFIF